METILVFSTVGAALFYLVARTIKNHKRRAACSGCSCQTNSCGSKPWT
ncbi:MAG: FeoB-associated Cys-rich membrane protein [Spirochaetia bacterium]|nr:FeoB-associated Cys-rich membrane protein [Spirochaetia bacterium]